MCLLLSLLLAFGLCAKSADVVKINQPATGPSLDKFVLVDVTVPKDSAKLTIRVTDENGNQVGDPVEISTPAEHVVRLMELEAGANIITANAADTSEAKVRVIYTANDERRTFEANAFAGVVVDSFAAADLNRYINPEENAKIKERAMAGFDIAYRLHASKKTEGRQLWVFAKTIHGTRSAGVNCTADSPDGATCIQSSTLNPAQVLKIVRNATSLEAFAGLRYEFKRIREDTDSPAAIYVKGQAGFLTVAGDGGDLVNVHHFAVGAMSTAGRFARSYLEVGVGKTDLYPEHTWPRLRIDGYLQFPLFGNRLRQKGLSGFARITVDSSWAHGAADSIQSYFGINYDVRNLF